MARPQTLHLAGRKRGQLLRDPSGRSPAAGGCRLGEGRAEVAVEDAAGLQSTAVGEVVAATAPDVVAVENGELPPQPRRQQAEEAPGPSATGEGSVAAQDQDQAPPIVPDQLYPRHRFTASATVFITWSWS